MKPATRTRRHKYDSEEKAMQILKENQKKANLKYQQSSDKYKEYKKEYMAMYNRKYYLEKKKKEVKEDTDSE